MTELKFKVTVEVDDGVWPSMEMAVTDLVPIPALPSSLEIVRELMDKIQALIFELYDTDTQETHE